MKKIFFAIFTCLCFIETRACDICGCGVGGSYIGLLPEFHRQIFGLRYRYNSLLTHIGVGSTTSYLTTNETYRTMELWGGWNISNKFRLMAAVPYSFNERTNQGVSNSKNGIGDISVTGYYQLLNKTKTVFSDKLLVQSLWIGGGVKLPTGKYNPSDKGAVSENTNLFQLGTASVDFTANAMYDVRLQDAGINMSASYKMNTENKFNYRYGNKFNASAQAYYKLRIRKTVMIAPNAGIMYETSQKDHDNKFAVDVTGGNLLTAALGIETAYKKISVGANWQIPLSQNLANGFAKANNKLMVHVSFIL